MALPSTSSTAGLAAQIVRSALNASFIGSKNTVPVMLPRRASPVYLMPMNHEQPWALLPMKAAVYQQYPNFFNASCGFFGSIDRDLKLGRPCSILRVSKAALDMAKVMRNLGIISSYQIGQKLNKLTDSDYVWQEGLEPEHASELAVYKYKYLRLDLRWDLFKPVWESSSATLSQRPLSVPEALPLSVLNISRASRPVLMTPEELRKERQAHGSGIFIAYHHQLGITTDAALDILGVPGLIMAHVGLPVSHEMQIRTALKQKLRGEAGRALDEMEPLKSWSMVDFVRQGLDKRQQVLEASGAAQKQRAQIMKLVEGIRQDEETTVSRYDISSTLHKELVAWQLKAKMSQALPAGRATSPGPGGRPSTAGEAGGSREDRAERSSSGPKSRGSDADHPGRGGQEGSRQPRDFPRPQGPSQQRGAGGMPRKEGRDGGDTRNGRGERGGGRGAGGS